MPSFYFYDLETSGANPNKDRIMQFAGQRTDEKLKPIGEPDNILVKLADDVIPEPDAILVHGITPQKTLEEGITEAEFSEYFYGNVALADTVMVGFNNIRFDDEFTRRSCYRTFNDPYQWHWKDGRSRWDILDVTRMMRALRPEGLEWPFIKDKPTVKLELMAKENGLTHKNAHDALSDVVALIELTQKIREAQPKLFEYLFRLRDKKSVAKLVKGGEPFIYTSGRYNNDHLKTTMVSNVFDHPRRDSSVVYDLREDPEKWLEKTPEELAEHWRSWYEKDIEKLPVKLIQYNRCPAIAPLGVLDEASKERIALNVSEAEKNRDKLDNNPEFVDKLKKALDIMEDEQQSRLPLDNGVDYQMYDDFWNQNDQNELTEVREATPDDMTKLLTKIKNKRIREMLPLYKARNFPKDLTQEESKAWEEYRRKSMFSGGKKSRIAKFSERMAEIPKTRKLSENDEYLLTELQLYVESILPEPEDQDSE